MARFHSFAMSCWPRNPRWRHQGGCHDRSGVPGGWIERPSPPRPPRSRAQLTTSLRTKPIEGGIAATSSITSPFFPWTTGRLLIAGWSDLAILKSALTPSPPGWRPEEQFQRLLSVPEPALIVFMFVIVGSLPIMVPMIQAASKFF